jgi:CubicO group peptidase (beta-lactamase class C family)
MTALAGSLALAACTSDGGGDGDGGASVNAATTAAAASTSEPQRAEPAPSAAPTSSAEPVTTVSEPAAQRTYDFSAVGPIVDAAIAEHGLEGAARVVVERDDGIVHEQYWGQFGPDRVSLIASSSKMVVAGVLLRLADQGLIDLDAPLADAVEWGSGNPSITPAQLVSNSSGLVGLGPNPAYPPYLCQFLPGGTLQDCAASIFTTTNDDADVIPPDTEFRYGGAQWQVAGALAEAVSGRSWAELIEETYAEPCGVDSLGFNNQWTQFGPTFNFGYPAAFGADPSRLVETANPNIEGGAYVTAPDYARLLLMLLRDGRCDDVRVLSPSAVEAMLADRIGEVYGGSDNGRGYGFGWSVDRTTGRRLDPGAYGSVAWLDVDAVHGAFLVVESSNAVGNELASQLFGPVADAVSNAG